MTETVILHVGMHKTGSTAIQQSFTGYDDGHTFYGTFDTADHSEPMFAAFKDDFYSYHAWVNRGMKLTDMERQRAEYRAEFTKQLLRKDRKRLIISAEDISLFKPTEKQALIDFILDNGCDLHVVCYVREPTEFAASRCQQNIKGGATSIEGVLSPLYKYRLATFSDLLLKNRLTVRAFDRSMLIGGDIVSDFASILKLDESLVNRKTANVGLSLPATKVLLAFNKTKTLCSKERALHRARIKLVNRIQKKYASGEKLPLSSFASIADYSEIDYLREKFNIDFSKSEWCANDETSVEGMFSDLSCVDTKPLDELLHIRDAPAENFTSIPEKVVRLYYALLAEELSQPS